MASHTPGPWNQDASLYLDAAYAAAKGKEQYAWPPNGVSDDEIEANARLIASAPELLAALDRLLETVEDEMVGLIDRKTIRARKVANITDARAAIRAARGV